MNKEQIIIKELELENKYMVKNIDIIKNEKKILEDELYSIKASKLYKCLLIIRKLKWW